MTFSYCPFLFSSSFFLPILYLVQYHVSSSYFLFLFIFCSFHFSLFLCFFVFRFYCPSLPFPFFLQCIFSSLHNLPFFIFYSDFPSSPLSLFPFNNLSALLRYPSPPLPSQVQHPLRVSLLLNFSPFSCSPFHSPPLPL